jgi:hypothetical protein
MPRPPTFTLPDRVARDRHAALAWDLIEAMAADEHAVAAGLLARWDADETVDLRLVLMAVARLAVKRPCGRAHPPDPVTTARARAAGRRRKRNQAEPGVALSPQVADRHAELAAAYLRLVRSDRTRAGAMLVQLRADPAVDPWWLATGLAALAVSRPCGQAHAADEAG